MVEYKDMLKPKKTNWNPSQFSLLPTLMMWRLAEKLGPFIRKPNTHLAQEWQKLKEDPGEGVQLQSQLKPSQPGGSAGDIEHDTRAPVLRS